jgi:hypothetical protein
VRTAISKASSDLAFLVRDVEYDLRLGWRGAATAFAGRLGKTFVDAEGMAQATFVAAGYESPGYRRFAGGRGRARIDYALAAGPVVDDRGVDASGVVLGGARLLLGRLSGGGTSLDVDLGVAGLIGDGRFLADLTAGPSVSFPVDGGRRASFFVHWERSRNPLGLQGDYWLAGLTYEEGRGAPGPDRGAGAAPEIDGSTAVGAGGGRAAGQLLLRFLSPSFGPAARAVFLGDANVLTGEDVNELYYRYHVGLERPWSAAVAGAYFYHRSNHVLSEPNEVTSVNVVELGIESPGRIGGVRAPARRVGLDGWLRAGYLLDSSFGEDVRWHARGGARLVLASNGKRFLPFLLAEIERGDADGSTFALGTSIAGRVEVQCELRQDDQYFGSDDDAVLLTARYVL